jgi:hypothetical protein
VHIVSAPQVESFEPRAGRVNIEAFFPERDISTFLTDQPSIARQLELLVLPKGVSEMRILLLKCLPRWRTIGVVMELPVTVLGALFMITEVTERLNFAIQLCRSRICVVFGDRFIVAC